MTTRTLLFRSLAHYWRTHLGVVLGVALAALVLTGSLMVGDSVKATLRAQAEARVGHVGRALVTGEHFLPWSPNADLRISFADDSISTRRDSAGVLLVQGTAERTDHTNRANRVQILGVDAAFWALSPSEKPIPLSDQASPQEQEVAVNEQLAHQLNLAPGATLSLRLEKPGAISKDAPLSGEESGVLVIKARVTRVVRDGEFGRFALVSGQIPPPSAFLPLSALQDKLGLADKVNLVLEPYTPPPTTSTGSRSNFDYFLDSIGLGSGNTRKNSSTTKVLEDLRMVDSSDDSAVLAKNLRAFDIDAKQLPEARGFEIRSPRIFLDAAVVTAARANEKNGVHWSDGTLLPALAPGLDSLTYFVTALEAGDGTDPKAKAAPYSMVTALDAPSSGFVQAELADDEIQITRWLADDLGIGPGAKVTLKYFVMGERRQLLEKSRTFRVLGPIIEMNEPQLNSSWMPDFPNVPGENDLKKWKPGFPFKSELIRKQDELYWKEHRGTPKAFLNLHIGQEMWGNRWGNLTSIRYPAGTKKEQVTRVASFVVPAALGYRVIPLREQAFAATDAPVDFGQLFASFSFFLIIAAAILTGLLFTFSIEQRAAEAGLLLAVGWRVRSVRRLFLREGFLLALLGSLAGVGGAIVYTKLVLKALAGAWSGATGGTQFIFAIAPLTLVIGVVSSIVVALLAMWLASRRLFKRQASQLLAGENTEDAARKTGVSTDVDSRRSHPWTDYLAAAMAIGAIVLAALARGNPGAFFGAGSLLLIAGILYARATLHRVSQGTGVDTLADLAARNTSRRTGRSLATIAVLASGVFMVVAVDSFRKGPLDDASRHESGTGGFTLVGESSSPIYEDLNSQAGREKILPDYDKLPAGLHVVQLRVRDGDDASCLNLNRALQPRLLGVKPEELAGRFTLDGPTGAHWSLLAKDDDAIPGIVDANTLQWAMQKGLGDVLEYTDERGQPLRVRLVATVSDSMLQGQVLISEKHFTEKFPNAAGYRFFLIDCLPAQAAAVRDSLSQQLADRGLELALATQRLADFNAVENTYLSIFQVLGGLGMLLGSAGLGIVVARNVLERRREFGLLEAVGFTPLRLRALVFAEHRWLIAGALGLGAASAILAVWPQLAQKGGGFPWGQVGLLFGGMALVSALCAWAATRLSLRGSQLTALRNE